MKLRDMFAFGADAMRGYPVRTGLMLLAMAIGVASVVVLTSLGEGARRYVSDQFSSLGSNLLIVLPGRSETVGGAPPIMGTTSRDLTVQDAMVLTRSSAVKRVAPVVIGSAPVSHGQLSREVIVVGSTEDFYAVRNLRMAQGGFLPESDPTRQAAICVLGSDLKQELFGNRQALGKWVRINDRRYRVIGVLASQGQSLGIDLSDMVVVPVASALSLFNTESLFRVLVQASSVEAIPKAQKAIGKIIRERHDGEDDVTVITQDALLSTFDRIFRALTFTVAGIAAISLAVAGILVMNVMLVAVSQRTAEIGLLKALGAPRVQIERLFLTEAALLSLAGAVLGAIIALAGTWILGRVFPDFPISPPLWAFVLAILVALANGLGFGVLPARRAARLDPVQALAGH